MDTTAHNVRTLSPSSMLLFMASWSQMPKGVPVATVAIGNAANAGLLAVRILATSDPLLMSKMLEYQDGMKQTVLGKADKLEAEGWSKYKV